MKTISGIFVAAGTYARNFDIGFIPDYLELFELTSGPKVLYKFYKALYDAETTGQYGLRDTDDGASAALEACADADNGFIPYTEGEDLAVMIEHPNSGKLTKRTVADYTVQRSTNATARAATAAPAFGTILRPTVHNGFVYECLTAGTGAAEPTWPTVPGETVQDDSSVLFICRKEIIAKGGGLGFTIGATLAADSDVWAFKAERHDRVVNFGDVDGLDPVTLPYN